MNGDLVPPTFDPVRLPGQTVSHSYIVYHLFGIKRYMIGHASRNMQQSVAQACMLLPGDHKSHIGRAMPELFNLGVMADGG